MQIFHYFSSGTYCKETHFAAGECGEKHVHDYDHLSVLASGRVELKIDDVSVWHDAPKILTIAAGKSHQVTALTPVVWLCLHATDCTDPEQVDGVLTGAGHAVD